MYGIRRLLAADEALALSLQRWQQPLLTRWMRIATRLGDVSSWLVFGLILLLAGAATASFALRLTVAALLATAVSQVLKRTCRRRRPSARLPSFTALVENPDAFSFPSGHTAAAVAVAIALAGCGDGLGALFAVLAGAIAVSRVYLGAHFPLDVFAGAVLGALAGAVTQLLL